MIDLSYRSLIWLTYRMAAGFALGLPLVLLTWSWIKKATSMRRLLTIYWKIASLMAISILLLTDQRPIGYILFFIAPILMVGSLWFWIDLNEELSDLPPWRPLPLTIRIWRWTITIFGFFASGLNLLSLNCISQNKEGICTSWLEPPRNLHLALEKVFGFLFGANWTEPLAAFVGYAALIAYLIGIFQWIIIRLPKQGRIAGEF